MKNDGGPAFPFNAGEFGIEPSCGMTLRDWFAGQALAGLLPIGMRELPVGPDVPETTALMGRIAYSLADAMLAAREDDR